MKKLPNGISNYEELLEDGYYYLDKTYYIEELESLSDKRIIFLRPRKFGKTLFTSVLENYYDVLKKEKFEKLFGETYIGKNPTVNKNKYFILKFNFSGIDTESTEATIKDFKEKVALGISRFIDNYNIDFNINLEQTAEDMLRSIFLAFRIQKPDKKIYVIIDEYDSFANELREINKEEPKKFISKNNKVRIWYEVLKEGTESIVDRIFMTGVVPVTLDGLTSGFNISRDITKDGRFNEALGFNKEELTDIMNNQELEIMEQQEILSVMKEYYGGYKFSVGSENYMYNPAMCIYFLSNYIESRKIPERPVNENITNDYTQFAKILDLYQGGAKQEIIEDALTEKGVICELTEKFNSELEFNQKDLISMLYYLGYLTISERIICFPKLTIPNRVMRENFVLFSKDGI